MENVKVTINGQEFNAVEGSNLEFTIPPEKFSFAIEELSDELLDKLFHGVIFEMNRRKAKRQGVDVGFWSSDGEYKKDIQPVTPEEINEINIQAQREEKE